MKLLFDHVEKCGGITVLFHLKKCFPVDDQLLLYGDPPCSSLETLPSVMPSLVAGHHANYVSHRCDDHKKVTVLREPIQRVISLYRFCKQQGYLPKNLRVSDFIRRNPSASNYYTWRFSGIAPYLVRNCPSLAVDRAMAMLETYTAIGFTDHIERFLASLELQIEYVPAVENKTIYREAISESDMQLIRSANELDMQVYQEVVTNFANIDSFLISDLSA